MHTLGELRTLIAALQKSDAQNTSDAEPVKTAFELDERVEPSLGVCERKLHYISKEVKLLENRLKFLEREQEKGQLARWRATNKTRPIGRLPNEVLSEILCLSTLPDGRVWRSPTFAVTHQWRQVAIRTPRLWSKPYITPDTSMEELELWLRRSCSCMLDIKVWELSSIPQLQAMRHIIAVHLDRIRSLDIDVGLFAHEIFLLHLASSSLTALSIKCDADDAPTSPIHLFVDSPPLGLKNLKLDTHTLAAPSVLLSTFNPSSLTILEVWECVVVDSVWNTLANCAELRELIWRSDGGPSIDVEGVTDTTRPISQSATMPKLSKLSVNGSVTAALLDMIDAPLLERLEIGRHGDAFSDILPKILRHQHVQQVYLDGIEDASAHDPRALFEGLPLLEYFAHDAWDVSSIAAIDVLTPPARSFTTCAPWSCHKLSVLYISAKLLTLNTPTVTEMRDREEFARVMKRYLCTLLQSRKRESDHALTAFVRQCEGCKALQRLNGMDGVEWMDNDYEWPQWY